MKIIIGVLVGFAAGFYFGDPDTAVSAARSLLEQSGLVDYFNNATATP